jgi:hypothetical protein
MPDLSRSSPGQVLLFSGHMIDREGREVPRFPPEAEGAAAARIAAELDKLDAGAGALGITEGACGGDILFAEALLSRGASLELRLPLPEPDFISNSVAYPKKTPPPDRWVERFRAVRRDPRVRVRQMPEEWQAEARANDVYSQCNLWMLHDALALGRERLSFICLWNGETGDGVGGTEHMKRSVEAAGCKVVWIDTRRL